MDLGPSELLIILAVILVLFGGAKLPQLARSLGQAKNEFEKGIKGYGDKASETPPSLTAGGGETVTMSRAELERLVDERVREATQAPGTTRGPELEHP